MGTVLSLLTRLFGSRDDSYPTDRKAASASADTLTAEDGIPPEILEILRKADKNGQEPKCQVSGAFSPQGYSDNTAKAIIKKLKQIVKQGRDMVGKALIWTIEMAEAAAKKCLIFVKEHPRLTAALLTAVAVAVLVKLGPGAIGALGFGKLGPVSGMYCHEKL